MPMLSSVSTEMETFAPLRARIRHSSSVRVLQWTWTWSGPIRPAASSSVMPLGSVQTQPVWVTWIAERSRAAATSAAVADSGMTPTSVSATPSVRRPDRDGKYVSASRAKSFSRALCSWKCGGAIGLDSKNPYPNTARILPP